MTTSLPRSDGQNDVIYTKFWACRTLRAGACRIGGAHEKRPNDYDPPSPGWNRAIGRA